MFNLFQKPKLVGNVPANVRVNGKLVLFVYMLFEKGDKRSCEIEIMHNKHLAIQYYNKFISHNISLPDFIGKNHKVWERSILPWLSGGTLDSLYTVSNDGVSIAYKIYEKALHVK